jgi:intracellular septation protein A
MIGLFSAFKPILSDFLSTIVFVILMAITDNLVLSVLAGMGVGVAQIVLEKLRGRRIEIMQWASFALVIVLGSAAIFFSDARFAMIKPSVGNFAIGLVMLTPNWMSRYLPQIVKENVSATALAAWGYVWAALEIALAILNAFIALTLGKKIWLEYTAFVPFTAMIGLFLLQYVWLRAAVHRSLRAKTLRTA